MQDSRIEVVSVQNVHMPVHGFHATDYTFEIRAEVVDARLSHIRLISNANLILLAGENQR
jgi:hypothetical protein